MFDETKVVTGSQKSLEVFEQPREVSNDFGYDRDFFENPGKIVMLLTWETLENVGTSLGISPPFLFAY